MNQGVVGRGEKSSLPVHGVRLGANMPCFDGTTLMEKRILSMKKLDIFYNDSSMKKLDILCGIALEAYMFSKNSNSQSYTSGRLPFPTI